MNRTLKAGTGDTRASRGFTIVELAAVMAVAGVAGVMFGVMHAQPTFGKPGQDDGSKAATPAAPGGLLDALAKSRESARQLKCSTHVRGNVQAMIIWANNNDSYYPLPSMVDAKDETVAEKGRAKDTTANILSLLIFNSSTSPEIAMCPSDTNPKIAIDKDYEWAKPKAAKDPKNSLWDPAFSADFEGGTGNVSYAHLQTSGGLRNAEGKPKRSGRMTRWSDTFSANEAIFGDRGPEVKSVTTEKPDDLGSYAIDANKSSRTLKHHGPPDSWEGNIAFNDGHVDFMTAAILKQKAARYTTKDQKQRFDALFFDEADDANETNVFLGIFTRAGEKPAEFKAIWD
jgi:hypothetical protein